MSLRLVMGRRMLPCTGGANRLPRAGLLTRIWNSHSTVYHRVAFSGTTTSYSNDVMKQKLDKPKSVDDLDAERRRDLLISLREDMTCNHFRDSVWGFVIYRCSSKDQQAWDQIIGWLREGIKEDLPQPEHKDILEAHDLHVIDDEDFYGASHYKVRRHFRWWAEKSLRERLRPGRNTHLDLKHELAADVPRYKYCLFVDDICLESTRYFQPVVKLLHKNWYDDWTPEERRDAVVAPAPWHDGITDYGEEDVGWMYLGAGSYLEMYLRFSDCSWHEEYQRPPMLDCSDWEGYDKRKWFPHHLAPAKE